VLRKSASSENRDRAPLNRTGRGCCRIATSHHLLKACASSWESLIPDNPPCRSLRATVMLAAAAPAAFTGHVHSRVMRDSSVIVIGAGIGGLAAALGLLRAGQRVEVYEQAGELGEVGAGLSITPNAGKAIAALGLREALGRIGSTPPLGVLRHYATGEILVRLGQDQSEAKYGIPLYHVHRADLHGALADAVRALDPACIRTGRSFERIEQRGDRVTAHFADGPSAGADWLIGADGIRSSVRAALFGREAPHFTGYVAWRGLVPGDRVPADLMDPPLCMTMGPGRMLMRYPLRRGALVNYVAVARREAWAEEGWSVKSEVSELLAEFHDFEPHARRLLELTPPDRCFRWGLFDPLYSFTILWR